ncbi:hypothetical protein VSS37_08200 [Candidatus Thiothrix sp. Deng01]|uniref:Uncharacterized protein n=1 Tax=Candidatus Thiothrix phosphatis TaxID=3112415 RepID=A0ABU6CVZ0_9GAMM|nr:hypothetical protein [Candidatus Thiothrix sp. Deng01]MEB4590954.1 hypothetical protein [Candidatus Thiothrix sp. Deng01]
MMILKKILTASATTLLLAGTVGSVYADNTCHENCPANTVTYKVNTYEDNQDYCGYDIEAKPQVCVNAQVVQVDTTKITHTAGDGTSKLNAETASDVKYTSRVAFSNDI